MNQRVLISVDLDFFNYVHSSFLSPILAAAMGAGIRKAPIFRDHLPDSYNAWPGHKAWKNYTIWNYDEHSDDGRVRDCQEEIGTWCSWLQRKGAKITWVSEKEHNYSCSADDASEGVDTELLIEGGEDYCNQMPLPDPETVDGLAFFTSPGYLADDAIIYKVFDLCAHYNFRLNGKLAKNWLISDIQRNIP